MTAKLPVKQQSFRFRQRLPPFGGAGERSESERVFNQKTGRCGMQQPGKSMRAYQKPYAVRGKGSTSRMFWMPVRYMIMRSKPRP